MNRLLLERLQLPGWSGSSTPSSLNVELEPGCHGLLLSPGQSLRGCLSLLGGESRPKQGRVLLDGHPLLTSPRARAMVGVLGPPGSFVPLGETPRGHLDRVREQRRRAGVNMLRELTFLPAETMDRSLRALSAEEQRLLQLEVAFSLEEPRALMAANPLAGLPSSATERVLSLLRRAAERDIVALAVSTTKDQVLPFAEQVLGLPRSNPERVTFQLRVERPREVAARAQALEYVEATRIDPTRPDLLEVTGHGGDDLAAALTRIIVDCDCGLQEITALPSRGSSGADLGLGEPSGGVRAS